MTRFITGGEALRSGGIWNEDAKPPTTIQPRSTALWQGYYGRDAGMDGYVYYRIGDVDSQSQINIDFQNDANMENLVKYRAYDNNSSRYTTGWRATDNGDYLDQNLEIAHTYAAEGDKIVPNTQLGGAPSAAVLDGKLYCFHRAASSDKYLWFNVYDNSNWLDDRRCDSSKLVCSPSAVVYDHKIWVFFQDQDNKGELWYNVLSSDGPWSGSKRVDSMGLSSSPSAIEHDGKIWVFHQGLGDNKTLFYNVFNGRDWEGDRQINDNEISESPAAVVADGVVHCFYQGHDHDGSVWFTKDVGATWQKAVKLDNTMLSSSPSAVAVAANDKEHSDRVLVFHQGSSNDDRLWFSRGESGKWQPARQLYSLKVGDGPGAVIFNDKIYCFHEGSFGLRELLYKTLNVTDI